MALMEEWIGLSDITHADSDGSTGGSETWTGG
jgi:hypothetical protein